MQTTIKPSSEEESGLVSYGLYAVYDKLAQEFGPPYVAANDRVAARNYQRIMSESPADTREDFDLYFLGFYEHRPLNPEPPFKQVLHSAPPRLISVAIPQRQ